MDKAQLPVFAELSLGADTRDSTPTTLGRKFSGTSNPRHERVIVAGMTRPRTRKEVDRIAGASNGPELIAELRRRGLTIPCHRVPGIDRDGYPVKFGVYEFNDDDRRKVAAWLRQRDAQAKAKIRTHFVDYEARKRQWDCQNPDATSEQRDAEMNRIALECGV